MPSKFFITTAIDYPNSRPHIGTAFEKIGADVQARFQRMQGKEVFFLMGNDENTIKVARRATELQKETKAYCDDMANQFKEVWRALDISFDDFIQTSEPRHHAGCKAFIQKVFDAGYIYKSSYEGWYCDGCEAFKTEKELDENKVCPSHKVPAVKRVEPCYHFALSKFQNQLLRFYEDNPEFIQPESRRNEVISLVQAELKDVNITRSGQTWGIPVPFDPEFTIYVWFDALLNYITAIGYGSDEERFNKWWPADLHVIGKDITRFHCALWPAMCFAAGIAPPKKVFGHGFVYVKNEETGDVQKISKSLGNVVEPMDIITKFSAEAFRYYFLRECPFPGDGEFSLQRFVDLYNSDLANNLGNLFSRVVGLIGKNYDGVLENISDSIPMLFPLESLRELVGQVKDLIERCQYNQALQKIWQEVLDIANQHADKSAPWTLVKTDKEKAKEVLIQLVEGVRITSILLKPFLPKLAEKLYTSFDFEHKWAEIRFEDIAKGRGFSNKLRILAELEGGKVKPLLPRVQK